MIEVGGLRVRWPHADDDVLAGTDLDVRPGEHVLVLGASGSGKSTLLRTLAGVVPQQVDAQTWGRVQVAGRRVLAPSGPGRPSVPTTTTAHLARDVGTLTQDPWAQLCLPTVTDEVASGLEHRGVPAAEIDARVREALRAVGAAHLADRRTATLSGGEGQRVALAAVLAARPRVLLLDEPTALLDPAGAAGVARALRAAGGPDRTTLLVEHRLDEHDGAGPGGTGGLPDRVVVLGARGHVVADGPTADVLGDAGGHLAALGTWLPWAAELAASGARRLADVEAAPVPSRGTPGPALLEARGLVVHRGGRRVLDGVSLAVRAGRVTAVVGLNGSGKSSLLLALAGLLPADGVVRGGRAALVLQRPEQQLLARTVRDEVAWGPRRAGARDAEARADAALARYGLTAVAGADPFRLSGGQQRRLALASVTVCDHEVVLADEPTFGQDRATWRSCAVSLRGLADEGRGVVLVTHDVRLVAEVADDVLVLRDGRALAHGPVEAVLRSGVLAGAGLPLPPAVRAALADGRGAAGVLAGVAAATVRAGAPAGVGP
ncbi:ATP-binding cassette domain-containing protein [Cellulomonas sp.]|uniref:ABC transporter ATP-binding protein n=1 Tax=Cellulomonas sp. TaxID=40001 RepID=UPI0028122483|nr:ATP-binding cassette domain-containing protein [Cellulomonas sp.]